MTVTRDELHRLVNEVPAQELENAGRYLGWLAQDEAVEPPRRSLRSVAAFDGPSDLAARSEEILRHEWGAAE